MKRKASAVWEGAPSRMGRASSTTASGVLSNTQYSFTHALRERRRARIPRS